MGSTLRAVAALFYAFFISTFTAIFVHAQSSAVPIRAELGSPVIIDPTDGIEWMSGQSLTPVWSWLERPGTSVAEFSDASILRPTFTPDVNGSWIAQLDLFDDPSAAEPVKTLLINISTENLPPVSQIEARGLPGGASPITLDGSSSYDVDGQNLTYAWSIASAPSGHSASFDQTDRPTVDFAFDLAGQYVVQLIVQDNTGATSAVTEYSFDVASAGASGPDLESTLETFNLVTQTFFGRQEVEGRTFIASTIQNVTGQFGFNPASDGEPLAELYVNGDLLNSTINLTPGDLAKISGSQSNSNVNNGTLEEGATDLPEFDFQTFRDQSAFLASLTGEPADLSNQNNKRFGGAPNAVESEATFGPNTRIVTATLQDLQTGGYSIDLSQADTVIINVSGTSGNFQMNPLGGTGFAENVIWNFFEATSIDVNSVIVGHVLAPYARMSGFAGSSEGTVIADDVQLTNGELHQRAWLGQVPSPAENSEAGSSRDVAPVASARFDQLSTQVGAPVVIEPFASTDIDGSSLTAEASIISTPDGAMPTLVPNSDGTATFSADTAGDYLVGYTVSDGARQSQDQVLVSVEAGNLRPVARISDLRDASVGTPSQLDGSQSYDLDGDFLSYQWSLLSAPTGSASTPIDSDTPFASITPDAAGLYVLQLMVSDGTASSAPTTLPLIVGAPLPVAQAGRDVLPDATGQATLDGSLSSGGALSYVWSAIGSSGDESSFDDARLVSPLLSLPASTIEFRDAIRTQTVYENRRNGLNGACVFDVVAPAEIENPQASNWNGIAFWANGRVSVDGSDRSVWVIDNQRDFNRTVDLIDTNGTFHGTYIVPGRARAYVTSDLLSQGTQMGVFYEGNQIRQAGPATYTFNRTDNVCATGGFEVAQLIVSDDNGTSLPDTVFVGDTGIRPVLTRGADTQLNGGETATLNAPAVAFDANSDALHYSWSLIHRPDGSTATISPDPSVTKVSGETIDFTPDRTGAYLIQLEATDGVFVAEPVVFLIEIQNTPPIAAVQTIPDTFVGDLAVLDGSGSFDPNGDALTYNWTIISAPQGSGAAIGDPIEAIAALVPDRRGEYVIE
ncbi:MAG: collagen-binding domain-containing protein, partial [Pseudomonadota bacterium]